MTSADLGNKRLSIGQFRERPVSYKEIYEINPGYTSWALKLPLPTGPLAEFVRYAKARKSGSATGGEAVSAGNPGGEMVLSKRAAAVQEASILGRIQLADSSSQFGHVAKLVYKKRSQEWEEQPERWFAQIRTTVTGARHSEAQYLKKDEEVRFDGKMILNSRHEHVGWVAKEIGNFFRALGDEHDFDNVRLDGRTCKGGKYPIVDVQVFASPMLPEVGGDAARGRAMREDGILNAFLHHNLIAIAKARCEYGAVQVWYCPKGIRVGALNKQVWARHFPDNVAPAFVPGKVKKPASSSSSSSSSGSSSSSSSSSSSDAAALKKVDPESVLAKIYELSATDYASMPAVPNADTLVWNDGSGYRLLPHQAKAVAWMLEREEKMGFDGAVVMAKAAAKAAAKKSRKQVAETTANPGSSSQSARLAAVFGQFWQQLPSGKWRHKLTGSEFEDAPELPRGGILADEMGLGKTVSCVGCIAAADLSDCGPSASADAGPKCTLIVCPAVMVAAWEEVLRRGLPVGSGVDLVIWHGQNKPKAPAKASSSGAAVEVTVTTYQTLLHNEQELVAKRMWYRVILDEAHEARNRQSKTSQCIAKLAASIRWAVTGTPILNKIEEMFPLVRFLKVEPFDSWEWFLRLVLRPLNMKDPKGLERLNLLLRPFLLRREKHMDVSGKKGASSSKSGSSLQGSGKRYLLDLPEKRCQLVRVPLSEGRQLQAYNALFDLWHQEMSLTAQAAPKEMTSTARNRCPKGSKVSPKAKAEIARGPGAKDSKGASANGVASMDSKLAVANLSTSVGNTLTVLQRLRQICCTPELLPLKLLNILLKADMSGELESMSLNEVFIQLGSAVKKSLADIFTDAADEECSICLSSFAAEDAEECLQLSKADAVVATKCGHVFHKMCICDWAKRSGGECPMCRQQVDISQLQERPPDFAAKLSARRNAQPTGTQGSESVGVTEVAEQVPPKIVKMLEICEEIAVGAVAGVATGVVIFSSFVKMLHVAERHLQQAGFSTGLLTGDVKLKERANTIADFQSGSIRIVLCSLKCVGQGITLTAGRAVLLLDPWWNSAQEAQAIDRVHRIGFRHEALDIYRLYAENTIEEQIINLQRAKIGLISAATDASQSQAALRSQKLQELTTKLLEQPRKLIDAVRNDKSRAQAHGADGEAEGEAPAKKKHRKICT